jgi:hypothetical protein
MIIIIELVSPYSQEIPAKEGVNRYFDLNDKAMSVFVCTFSEFTLSTRVVKFTARTF